MKFKLLLLSCFMFAVTSTTISQDLAPCGTYEGRVPWLDEYQKNLDAYPRSSEVLLIPIKIHIVGTGAGSGYFPVNSALNAFCQLNEDFLPSDIQFFIAGDLNYIDNSTYFDHSFQEGAQMMEENNVSNTINCYIVDSPAGNCGYSSYGLGIALAKSCVGPGDHTWAHEVGHYLSLPHPFVGWEGYEHNYSIPAPADINGYPVEKTNGTNCANSADGFCDTAPDYLNYRWNCDNSSLSNQVQIDPEGVEFVSDGTLFMSYSLDHCSERFSDDQIDAMRANLMFDRPNLLNQADPLPTVDTAFLNAITPGEGAHEDWYQSIYFEWDPVPNATHYVLEFATFPDFPFVLLRFVVESNSTTITDLFRNKNYYWRIRPFNAQSTCNTESSNIAFFTTGNLSAVQTIEQVTDLSLQPNPVVTGSNALVNLHTTEPLLLDAVLLNTNGQTLQQFDWRISNGENQLQLETSGLEAGIYLLQLRSERGVMTRKVVIGI